VRKARTVADIGAAVRTARRGRGWTQADLAHRVGVSRQWVVALESGRATRAELGRVLTTLSELDLTMMLPGPGNRNEIRHPPSTTTVRSDPPDFDLNAHLASFVTFDRSTWPTRDIAP